MQTPEILGQVAGLTCGVRLNRTNNAAIERFSGIQIMNKIMKPEEEGGVCQLGN